MLAFLLPLLGAGCAQQVSFYAERVGSVNEMAAADATATPAPGAPVPIELNFVRLSSSSAWDNCVSVVVNGQGPEVSLGCNHDASAATITEVMGLPKPSCNTLRLFLYSNGHPNTSTANPSAIRAGPATDTPTSRTTHILGLDGFEVVPLVLSSVPTIYLIGNDNGDQDPNPNFRFTIDSKGQGNITIENSNLPCQ